MKKKENDLKGKGTLKERMEIEPNILIKKKGERDFKKIGKE